MEMFFDQTATMRTLTDRFVDCRKSLLSAVWLLNLPSETFSAVI